MRFRLAAPTLAEWAVTDVGWWRSLAEAISSFRGAQQSVKQTAAALDAETAHLRRK